MINKTLALPIHYKIHRKSYVVKSPDFAEMFEVDGYLEVVRSSEIFSDSFEEISYLFPETEIPFKYVEKSQEKTDIEAKLANKTTAKPKRNSYSMWIKGVPKDKDKKDEVTERLYDIFDHIKGNCLKNTWQDFKSLFNKNYKQMQHP